MCQVGLGKPTRVVTDKYPSGIPSKSPLCTAIDVMMTCQSLLTTHDADTTDKLLIIPTPANLGTI